VLRDVPLAAASARQLVTYEPVFAVVSTVVSIY
jgi:hypothetical protein